MSVFDNEYSVTFVGDYFSMTVCVQGVDSPAKEYDDDVIIGLAADIIQYQYGWDIKAVSTVAIDVQGGEL